MFCEDAKCDAKYLIKIWKWMELKQFSGKWPKKDKKTITFFTIPRREMTLLKYVGKPLGKQCFVTTQNRSQETL